MELMDSCSCNAQPNNESYQRHDKAIDNAPFYRNSFNQSVWILDIDIVDEEHAVERFDESDEL